MPTHRPLVLCLLSAAFALTLTGCSASFDPIDAANPAQTSVGTISGSAFGGRQPISGAHVYMFQANTTAYAGPGVSTPAASVSLLKSASNTTSDGTNFYATTAANGSFTITGDYNTCATGSQVYLYATGGKPDGTNANNEAGLLAVLGTCGSFSSSTTVNMNEVSTIAAAYSIAGFASDARHVGAPSGSNTLAATGINNAFANANQLYDISSNPYNLPNTVARTVTPGNGTNGGAGTVPQKQIDTLANILSACINSTGTSSSQCTTLIGDMKSGGTTGNTAVDTADIAIFMAQNAGTNTAAIYGITGSAPNPYSPWYNTAAPNDMSVQLVFTGAGLTANYLNYESVVIDASANVWVTSGQAAAAGNDGTILSGFDHNGVPLVSNGYGSLGLQLPQGMAVDATSSNLYISSFTNNSVVQFNLTSHTATKTLSTGSGSGPNYVAIDSAGYVWAVLTDDGNDSGKVVKIDPSNGTIKTSLTGNGINSPSAVAFQSGSLGNLWIPNAGTGGISVFKNDGTVVGNDVSNVPLQLGPLAFDSNNNGYIASAAGSGVIEVPTANIQTDTLDSGDSGYTQPELAIDGSNRIWFTNNDFTDHDTHTPQKNAVFLANTNLSGLANGANGYQAAPNTDTEPNSIAIDASGNIWYSSLSDGTLHEVVGAATPVSLPIAYATNNSKLGQRP